MKKFIVLSLFVLASVIAIAQQKSPIESQDLSAPGEFLRRSETVIKRTFDVRSKNPDDSDDSNIEMADRIARDAPVFIEKTNPGELKKYLPPSLGEHSPAAVGNRFVPKEDERAIYIFVSDSMPDAELLDAFQVSADTNAVTVFRGVRKGQSIDKFFIRSARLTEKVNGQPKIEIDPRPFAHFDIKVVPTVVVNKGADAVKVSGTLSVKYAMTRFNNSQFGDAGARGKTYDIIEMDLLDDIQERLSKIDFEAKKDAIIARVWKNYKFSPLPLAQVSKVSYFDPTVINEEEIRDMQGNIIAPAGASFNPLDIVPYDKTIIVFDASSAKQMKFAKQRSADEMAAGRGVLLLTTNVDRERGWDAYNEYNDNLFPNRIFLLNDEIVSRFGIKSIPSVIRAEGRVFRIEQMAAMELK